MKTEMIFLKKIVFYWAALSDAVAYSRLMAAADEIQKHGKSGDVCFTDWPLLKDTCRLFVKGELCSSKTCPLKGSLGLYLKAEARHEKAHEMFLRTQADLFCAIVKDRTQ